jgi:hypothetical protein
MKTFEKWLEECQRLLREIDSEYPSLMEIVGENDLRELHSSGMTPEQVVKEEFGNV